MPDLDNDLLIKLSNERFTGTKIQDFDQLTAVSQGAINRQLRLMHKIANENSPIRRFHTETSAEDDPWTCIKNAELEPPSVELLTDTDSKQTVLFTLKLKSGTFQYLGGKKNKPTEDTATIQDWRLVFRVRLNLKVLDRKNVPQFVQDVLLNMDDYSVHQLLVDFTTADISSYEKNLSHIDLPNPSAKQSFTAHIELYLNQLTTEKGNFHSTIHYLPTIKTPENYRAPSLRTTDMSFQNLAFVFSSSDTDGVVNDDKNMLIYLQMTENRKFPKDLLLWPKANWVVPPVGTNPKYDGTVCLSKRIFLDGWLLPKLARFNEATTWIMKSITYDPSVKPLPFRMDSYLGYQPSELPEKGTPCPWVLDTQKTTPNMLYYSYIIERDDQANNTKGKTLQATGPLEGRAGPGPDTDFCQQNAGTWNYLEIPVGFPDGNDMKCVIKISGSTSVWSWGPVMKAWCITTAVWTAEIKLDGVDHGQLMVKTNFPKPKITSELGVAYMNTDSGQGLAYKNIVSDLNQRVDAGVKKLDGYIDKIEREIQYGLTGDKDAQWRFIFGGNNDFFIDKATFNSEGDLLAQLVYQLKD